MNPLINGIFNGIHNLRSMKIDSISKNASSEMPVHLRISLSLSLVYFITLSTEHFKVDFGAFTCRIYHVVL